LVRGLEGSLRDENVVAEVLGDPNQLGVLHVRYEAFLGFLDDLGVAHPRATTWSWRHGGVLFAGLDTAWLASGDESRDRLVLGLAQVNAALADARPGETVIALAHHPLASLAEWDREAVTDPLQARVKVLLRGHLHRARPQRIQAMVRDCRRSWLASGPPPAGLTDRSPECHLPSKVR
jgi:hypothetical protein